MESLKQPNRNAVDVVIQVCNLRCGAGARPVVFDVVFDYVVSGTGSKAGTFCGGLDRVIHLAGFVDAGRRQLHCRHCFAGSRADRRGPHHRRSCEERHPRGTGNSDFARWLNEVPANDSGESRLFDLECRRQTFLWATSEIETEFRLETWRAFWETSVTGRSVEDVATELKMTAGAVYVARSRVMKRLREKVGEVQESE